MSLISLSVWRLQSGLKLNGCSDLIATVHRMSNTTTEQLESANALMNMNAELMYLLHIPDNHQLVMELQLLAFQYIFAACSPLCPLPNDLQTVIPHRTCIQRQ